MVKSNKEIEGIKNASAENKKRSVEQILNDMQSKLGEIDELRRELKREQKKAMTPQESRGMLEEIIVPSIETIRESKSKR